ncbi:MAG: hypothetical protein VW452_01480, partial [Pelagibacteraceae bacterium]
FLKRVHIALDYKAKQLNNDYDLPTLVPVSFINKYIILNEFILKFSSNGYKHNTLAGGWFILTSWNY